MRLDEPPQLSSVLPVVDAAHEHNVGGCDHLRSLCLSLLGGEPGALEGETSQEAGVTVVEEREAATHCVREVAFEADGEDRERVHRASYPCWISGWIHDMIWWMPVTISVPASP